MAKERQIEEKHFVEEVGLAFEQMGVPRMAGRILGWLLISDPPHQSTNELAAALSASQGSISSMSRLLIQFGLVERFSLPGIRRNYFRIRPGAFNHLLRLKAEQITLLRQLAERGLELVAGKSRHNRQWLEEMRDMYVFFEREFPALLERWEQARKAGKLRVR